MTLKRFLLYTRFGTQRPKDINADRWNAMLKYAESKFSFVMPPERGMEFILSKK